MKLLVDIEGVDSKKYCNDCKFLEEFGSDDGECKMEEFGSDDGECKMFEVNLGYETSRRFLRCRKCLNAEQKAKEPR